MMEEKKGRGRPQANYETVALDKLRTTRRGKHHDFVSTVMADLETLKKGAAIKVPLKDTKGESVVRLRAAINRASASKGMKISTMSDQDFFYIWRQSD